MSKFDAKPIKALIATLPEAKQSIANALLDKAVFMDAELTKLQKLLKEKGWVEKYQNGASQYGLKKSSEADVYISMMKNYNSTLKIISDLIPDDVKAEESDPLLAYIRK